MNPLILELLSTTSRSLVSRSSLSQYFDILLTGIARQMAITISEESYISLWDSWSLEYWGSQSVGPKAIQDMAVVQNRSQVAILVSVVTYYGLHTFLVITP
jgi:hypothetical protein